MQASTTSLPLGSGWRRVVPLDRHRLVIGAVAVGMIIAAMAWQWSWLVAIGAAPLLLSAAPCAAMCGLGLCMHRMSGRTCGTMSAQAVPMQTPRGQIENPADHTMNNGDAT